ncbi:hypothetical protein C8Q76DRAFT_59409 [Earliella scabrosa]|nr:hypothetical protein C8Q76DRAFT_59409 [Earliella scabrosa]
MRYRILEQMGVARARGSLLQTEGGGIQDRQRSRRRSTKKRRQPTLKVLSELEALQHDFSLPHSSCASTHCCTKSPEEERGTRGQLQDETSVLIAKSSGSSTITSKRVEAAVPNALAGISCAAVVCHQCKAVFKDEAACKMHGGAKGHRWQAPATRGRSVVVATGAPAQSSSANRESKGSFVCAVCMLEFADEEAYRKHMSSWNTCELCRAHFVSSLEEHYQLSSLHPKCVRCTRGFNTVQDYNVHLHNCGPRLASFVASTTANSEVPTSVLGSSGKRSSNRVPDVERRWCSPCQGFTVKNDDHYTNSPNHPKCMACGKGFENSEKLQEHTSSVRTCDVCMVHLESLQSLRDHYRTSSSHPTCHLCAIGFKTRQAYELCA